MGRNLTKEYERVNVTVSLTLCLFRPSMLDYGSMVPQALRTSSNAVSIELGRRLYLQTEYDGNDPYKLLIEGTLKGTHTVIVATFYLEWIIRNKGITHLTYLLDEKVHKFLYLYHALPQPMLDDRLIKNNETRLSFTRPYRAREEVRETKDREHEGNRWK